MSIRAAQIESSCHGQLAIVAQTTRVHMPTYDTHMAMPCESLGALSIAPNYPNITKYGLESVVVRMEALSPGVLIFGAFSLNCQPLVSQLSIPFSSLVA